MEQDEAAFAGMLASDLEATFAQVITHYWPQLYAFVLRRCTSPQEAEDIVAEAFIRAYVALKGYPAARIGALRLRAWLYKIAYHEYCRAASRARVTVLPLDGPEGEMLADLAEDEAQQPEHLVEASERRQEVEGLLAALPQRYREVVSLYYLEDFSYQEIADLLHQPLGTIKSTLHRGLTLLRQRVVSPSLEGE
jgi:RNA polymerase sigma-70 factor (ECF subfamily)